MTRSELTQLLLRLRKAQDPLTGVPLPSPGHLGEPAVRGAIEAALRKLGSATAADLLDPGEISKLENDLRHLGYPATPGQIARVLTGSRTIVDPQLRGLPAYRRFHGLISRRAVEAELRARATTGTETGAVSAAPDDIPDFFETGSFDQLTEAKAGELSREVEALGLSKPTSRLPAYMQRARETHLRSFEPWTREERALLIKAMCYTNDANRLAGLFGRSASAIRREGNILILKSRERRVA